MPVIPNEDDSRVSTSPCQCAAYNIALYAQSRGIVDRHAKRNANVLTIFKNRVNLSVPPELAGHLPSLAHNAVGFDTNLRPNYFMQDPEDSWVVHAAQTARRERADARGQRHRVAVDRQHLGAYIGPCSGLMIAGRIVTRIGRTTQGNSTQAVIACMITRSEVTAFERTPDRSNVALCFVIAYRSETEAMPVRSKGTDNPKQLPPVFGCSERADGVTPPATTGDAGYSLRTYYGRRLRLRVRTYPLSAAVR